MQSWEYLSPQISICHVHIKDVEILTVLSQKSKVYKGKKADFWMTNLSVDLND